MGKEISIVLEFLKVWNLLFGHRLYRLVYKLSLYFIFHFFRQLRLLFLEITFIFFKDIWRQFPLSLTGKFMLSGEIKRKILVKNRFIVFIVGDYFVIWLVWKYRSAFLWNSFDILNWTKQNLTGFICNQSNRKIAKLDTLDAAIKLFFVWDCFIICSICWKWLHNFFQWTNQNIYYGVILIQSNIAYYFVKICRVQVNEISSKFYSVTKTR